MKVDKIQDTSNLTRLYLTNKAYIEDNDNLIDKLYKEGLLKIFLLDSWNHPNFYAGIEMYICYVEIENPLVGLESYYIKLLDKNLLSTEKSIFEVKGVEVHRVTKDLVRLSTEFKTILVLIDQAVDAALNDF